MAKARLDELLQQKAALEKQIAEVQRADRTEAIAKVKALMAQYGLTLADIGTKPAPASAAAKPARAKVKPKYRNTATGETWSGRGLKPKWLTAALAGGRSLSEFTI